MYTHQKQGLDTNYLSISRTILYLRVITEPVVGKGRTPEFQRDLPSTHRTWPKLAGGDATPIWSILFHRTRTPAGCRPYPSLVGDLASSAVRNARRICPLRELGTFSRTRDRHERTAAVELVQPPILRCSDCSGGHYTRDGSKWRDRYADAARQPKTLRRASI